jgi:dsDNA-binding SOS-regulon protein
MVSRFTPQPAVRRGQKARLALAGPSGSGKTWTALEAATVLADGGPVLVADTERGSASLYADHFKFEVVEWTPPFDPRELAALIAEHGDGYDVIVCDSLSHFWEAEGGTRDIVDAAAARARGNSFAGWKEGTPAQNDMVNAMLNASCHIVATMRSKTEYIMEADSRGKQVPRKIGMAPIQRAGIEYEFTVTAELDYEHTLLVDKTRCSALAGGMFKMGHTVEMAETLRDWLGSAEAVLSKDEVKALVLSLAADDEEKATAAWHAIRQTPWTTPELTAAFQTWADPTEGETK